MKIDPSAIIHKGSELDTDVEIGPYAIIGPRVKLGKGTKVLPHAIVEGDTQLGENNIVGHHSVIGAEPQDLKFNGEDSCLVIGNNNCFREYVTINVGTAHGGAVTRIGNNCLLMAYVHVGHDSCLGNNIIIANSCNLAGHVVIEDHVVLTGSVGVSQFCRVGKHSYIGGHTGVDRNVPPYSRGFGFRMLVRGLNVIGLKRSGFSSERITAIQKAYKIYFQSGLEKNAALSQIENSFSEQEDVQYFVHFIRNVEKSGIAQHANSD